MIGLGALVVEHFDAVEADFARFYGVDLPAALWGPEPVTYRRLAVLVRGIPAESALGFATGGYRPGWGATEELLAVLAELVDLGNRTFFRVNSKRGAQQPRPIEIPRPPDPNEEPKKRRPATSEDLKALFGGAAVYTGPPVDDAADDLERAVDLPIPEFLDAVDRYEERELPEIGPVPDPRDVDP